MLSDRDTVKVSDLGRAGRFAHFARKSAPRAFVAEIGGSARLLNRDRRDARQRAEPASTLLGYTDICPSTKNPVDDIARKLNGRRVTVQK